MKKRLLLSAAIAFSVVSTGFVNPGVQALPGPVAQAQAPQINLSDAQKAQLQKVQQETDQKIGAILTAEQKKEIQTARQEKRQPKITLTQQQEQQIQAVRQNTEAQVAKILTKDQIEQIQKMQMQRQR
ncbi:MAG: hypothetical protein ACKN9E_08070 [Microcystaceae cyanobacterium]|nr:hypothetical protein [Merismopediaceae bacterium]